MTRARIGQSVRSWVTLGGAYATGMLAADVAIQMQQGTGTAVGEVLVSSLVSGLVFCLSSAVVLFRHRPFAVSKTVITGGVVGAVVTLFTWVLWLSIDPSFRHAVPIELLPLLVFPVVCGVLVGVVLYFAALRRV